MKKEIKAKVIKLAPIGNSTRTVSSEEKRQQTFLGRYL